MKKASRRQRKTGRARYKSTMLITKRTQMGGIQTHSGKSSVLENIVGRSFLPVCSPQPAQASPRPRDRARRIQTEKLTTRTTPERVWHSHTAASGAPARPHPLGQGQAADCARTGCRGPIWQGRVLFAFAGAGHILVVIVRSNTVKELCTSQARVWRVPAHAEQALLRL